MSRSWQFLEQFFLKAEVLERSDEEIVTFDLSDQLERISREKKKKKEGILQVYSVLVIQPWSKAISSSLQIQEQFFFFLFLAALPGLWDLSSQTKIEPGSLAWKHRVLTIGSFIYFL